MSHDYDQITIRALTHRPLQHTINVTGLAANGTAHEIFLADGTSVRFFLGKGESMTRDHMELLVSNAEVNITRVAPEQRERMRERIERIALHLRKGT